MRYRKTLARARGLYYTFIMKYIMIVPDGAADYPLEDLNGKTPMEVADTPFIDALQKGILGRVKTVPFGFSPSSDVANLSLLGYDPQKYYKGRGPFRSGESWGQP